MPNPRVVGTEVWRRVEIPIALRKRYSPLCSDRLPLIIRSPVYVSGWVLEVNNSGLHGQSSKWRSNEFNIDLKSVLCSSVFRQCWLLGHGHAVM